MSKILVTKPKLETLVFVLILGLVGLNAKYANSKLIDSDDLGNAEIESLTFLNLPSVSALTSGAGNITYNSSKPCNSSNLDTCWNQLPPLNEPGIPSTPAAVDVACRAFDTGMSCVEDWAKQCLGKAAREKVKTSVQGAHETFTFLCRDQKFRNEFLSHATCYRKISHLWDECAKRFIESLKRADDNHDSITICCIRLKFLQCVIEVAHLHCSQSAAKFLQRMAETLVRSTIRSHVPSQCVSISHQNCSETSGSPPSPQPSIISKISILHASSLTSPKLLIQYFNKFISFFSVNIDSFYEYASSFKLILREWVYPW